MIKSGMRRIQSLSSRREEIIYSISEYLTGNAIFKAFQGFNYLIKKITNHTS